MPYIVFGVKIIEEFRIFTKEATDLHGLEQAPGLELFCLKVSGRLSYPHVSTANLLQQVHSFHSKRRILFMSKCRHLKQNV